MEQNMEIINNLTARYNGQVSNSIRPTSCEWFRCSFSNKEDVDSFIYDLTFTSAVKAVVSDGNSCFVLL